MSLTKKLSQKSIILGVMFWGLVAVEDIEIRKAGIDDLVNDWGTFGFFVSGRLSGLSWIAFDRL